MPGRGCAYSTSASVTALPIAADFAFHLSVAMRRYWLPHPGSSLAEVLIQVISGRLNGYAFLRRGAAPVRLRGVVFALTFGAVFALAFRVNSEGSRRLAVFHKRS